MPLPALSLRAAVDLPDSVPVILPVSPDAVPPEFAEAAAAAGFGAAGGAPLLLWDRTPPRLLLALEETSGRTLETLGARAAASLHRQLRIAIDGRGLPRAEAVRLLVGAARRAWRSPVWRKFPDPEAMLIEHIDLLVDDPAHEGKQWRRALAMLEGQSFARDLVTEPGNLLTPARFAERLTPLTALGLEVEILAGAALEREGLGLLRAVGGGSANPPCLAVLRWPGTLKAPPVAFVGKGITFDCGGISIKSAEGMWEMRGDMAGAAACAGAMVTLAKRQSPAPAVAVLALAENMIGATSYRPGDILTGHAGVSIEIVDTDAEGRLVLADALSYAVARHRPRAAIDLATLTYSVSIAIGDERAGLFDNDALLAAHLSAAGEASGERLWRLPIGAGHRAALESDIADLRHCNAGRMVPDASQAAALLREFVGDTPWAHLDIAGQELVLEETAERGWGATGFGVRLLDQLMADRYEDEDHP